MKKGLPSKYLQADYPTIKIVGIADIPPEPQMYAVRKDLPQLTAILNKALKSVSREERKAIRQKWFRVQVDYKPNWREVLKWASAIGSVFTIILGISLYWNRRLAKEIGERGRVEILLNETGKMAHIGGWEIEVGSMKLFWSEEVYRIHEAESDNPAVVEQAIDFYTPESRPVIETGGQLPACCFPLSFGK